ncbi:hypothetical protein ES703_122164 [subsurface metagenome]
MRHLLPQHTILAYHTADILRIFPHIQSLDYSFGQLLEVHRASLLLFEPCVDMRDLTNASQQVLHAGHLVLDHPQKAFSLCRILDLRYDLCGRPDGGQRILELVGNIGGERFYKTDMLFQPSGQILEGPGQLSDFIPASGVEKTSLEPSSSVDELCSLMAKPTDWICDSGGYHEGDNECRGNREEEYLENFEPQLVDILQDTIGGLGDQGCTGYPIAVEKGNGTVEGDRALSPRRDPGSRSILSLQRLADLGPHQPIGPAVEVARFEGRTGRAQIISVEQDGNGCDSVEQALPELSIGIGFIPLYHQPLFKRFG